MLMERFQLDLQAMIAQASLCPARASVCVYSVCCLLVCVFLASLLLDVGKESRSVAEGPRPGSQAQRGPKMPACLSRA